MASFSASVSPSRKPTRSSGLDLGPSAASVFWAPGPIRSPLQPCQHWDSLCPHEARLTAPLRRCKELEGLRLIRGAGFRTLWRTRQGRESAKPEPLGDRSAGTNPRPLVRLAAAMARVQHLADT